VIAADGLHPDSETGIKRCYKFTTSTAPALALVCDNSVEGLSESTLGPINYIAGDFAPPPSCMAEPNCEWVDGAFSDYSNLPPVVCKKQWAKCTWS
jgi:hypothetical protein